MPPMNTNFEITKMHSYHSTCAHGTNNPTFYIHIHVHSPVAHTLHYLTNGRR
ncbi:hypothetical protein BCR41DRAFT_344718 [Lobosporangium transversale]|uniref:Uncharacterized protein n=1 Tax=Lobosporangium transversale TaxID=64571 RepID=A0A1Y2H356_9FUNG|nr:hypothetical protein BCR41DRAFT_344718 [Lobosporangium transversale]ORZ28143.1 hypothetical protein BCR41DRAFT_344718 [Lobosporangium transversale]|eukprot:XP_021885828.1 hypothetical protein BCR41DRAFT_344718 [Lobosporangium transversale]